MAFHTLLPILKYKCSLATSLRDLRQPLFMAGRNRMPRHPDSFRGAHEDPRSLPHRMPMPLPPHPAALEEELELQYRDIQTLLAENRHVIDDNVMLQRDLTSVKDEIHRLNQVIPKMHADKEAQRRELIERGMKLEAELRSAEPLRVEVVQLRADAQKLSVQNKELSSQAQTMTKDINRLQTENKQVAAMKSDIDKMHKDLVDTRYERDIYLIDSAITAQSFYPLSCYNGNRECGHLLD